MKRTIKFRLLALFFILAASSVGLADRCLFAQDKVVAVVNNEIVTQKDLDDFLNFIRMQYSREFKGKELEEKVQGMKQDLLQRLIDDRLILQQAKVEKVFVEPSRVKARVIELKKNYASDAEFSDDLAKQGLVLADLEKKIREQMLMYSVIQQKVREKIMVRPDEITDFYKQNKRQFLAPEERQLTMIILQDAKQAKELSYYLRLGQKLEDLATRYTFTVNTLSAWKGEELRKEIEDVVFKLGMGEISEEIKVDKQYYIFRLDNITGSRQLSLVQSQEKIRAYLFEKKLQDALTKWINEIKAQSYIKLCGD
ncbi:MAG: peptidyl-prolyl cis-trans isomerase [Candidatus Omnitrophica bacterium]|nr:peptidyl-prolyl cis-trans isomerase [Candidatus Omnitrophota bacterium]